MTLSNKWRQALNKLPLIAILRGITPEESVSIARILSDAGFSLIEVPLNSPSALKSIENIRSALSDDILVGAGTVLTGTQVKEVINVGGQLIIAPNFAAEVSTACRAQPVIYCPGIATPSEAFNALSAGADALKLFPAEVISPPVVKAMTAVLPAATKLFPVGGINPSNMQSYVEAGALGFGIGSSLYKPGLGAEQIRVHAHNFINVYKEACQFKPATE